MPVFFMPVQEISIHKATKKITGLETLCLTIFLFGHQETIPLNTYSSRWAAQRSASQWGGESSLGHARKTRFLEPKMALPIQIT